MKVLIADDSPIVLQRLVESVSQLEGIEIIGQARDGLEALNSIRQLKPDVVILDIKMPGENGIGVLTTIKKESPGVTVIMLTNYPYDAFRRKCVEAGADFFFDKTQFMDVIEAIRALISDMGASRLT